MEDLVVESAYSDNAGQVKMPKQILSDKINLTMEQANDQEPLMGVSCNRNSKMFRQFDRGKPTYELDALGHLAINEFGFILKRIYINKVKPIHY